MTNPNVPANQADAAKNSAPDAKVMPSQPAQVNQAAPAATPTGTAPVSPAPQSTAGGFAQAQPVTTGMQQPTPVDGAMRSNQAQPGQNDQARTDLKADRAEEQKVGKELDAKNAKSDYFQEVANNDAVVYDQSREEHRLMRQREAEAKKGDPTRDPVAKQEAMDMNTPEPGAKEEAEQMNRGEDSAKRSK